MTNDSKIFDSPNFDFSADNVIAYLKGDMPREQVLVFEKYLAANPFAMDAMEGLGLLEDPDEIRAVFNRQFKEDTKVERSTNPSSKNGFNWKLLLLIPLLLVGGWFINKSLNNKSQEPKQNVEEWIASYLKDSPPPAENPNFSVPELYSIYEQGDFDGVVSTVDAARLDKKVNANDLGLAGLASLFGGKAEQASRYFSESLSMHSSAQFLFHNTLALIELGELKEAKQNLFELQNSPKYKERAAELSQLLDDGD